jgi:DNA-directed RNA polymerase subunit K/omega
MTNEDPEASGPAPEVVSAAVAANRFLFVDVSALRAKQLRRGALPRLPAAAEVVQVAPRPEHPLKLERIAMEEVRQGIIPFELPDAKGVFGTDGRPVPSQEGA